MQQRMLFSALIAIGLSLALRAASAEPKDSTVSDVMNAVGPVPLANNYAAAEGVAYFPILRMPRLATSLSLGDQSVLRALQHNWWTEFSTELRVTKDAPRKVSSLTREATASIRDATWSGWQRPL